MLLFHCCVTMEMSQTHCYATVSARYYGNGTNSLSRNSNLRYYGKAANSLLRNRNYYVTIETPSRRHNILRNFRCEAAEALTRTVEPLMMMMMMVMVMVVVVIS
jgi:hypothetical protein